MAISWFSDVPGQTVLNLSWTLEVMDAKFFKSNCRLCLFSFRIFSEGNALLGFRKFSRLKWEKWNLIIKLTSTQIWYNLKWIFIDHFSSIRYNYFSMVKCYDQNQNRFPYFLPLPDWHQQWFIIKSTINKNTTIKWLLTYASAKIDWKNVFILLRRIACPTV